MRLAVILLPLLAVVSFGAETARNWTSSDGRVISATLLALDPSGVKLQLATGATVVVPLARLSAADQAYAQQVAKAAPTAVATTTAAGQPTADSVWPKSVGLDDKPTVEVVKEDAEAKQFIYRSPHYEFVCDSRLGQNVVREFGRVFETTYLINCKLPLDLKPQPEKLRTLFLAKLYTSKDDYMKNGGMQGSAGVYQSSEKALSVPLSSLGVKMVGSRVSLELNGDDDNATLIHEITHQMMNHWLPVLPVWYSEGSAEYVEMLEYNRNGRFSLGGMSRLVKAYAEKQNYGTAGSFTMLDLEELINVQDAAWANALATPVQVPGITGATQAQQNYGSAGLLTYYFYHLDGNGDAAGMIAYLRALEGQRDPALEVQALKKHLLRDRSYTQLAEDVKKAFRKEGIAITYSEPGKNGQVSGSAQ
jgi:hypothetical protein